MKKILRFSSAFFLLTQGFLSIPFHVLAEESQKQGEKAEQIQSSREPKNREEISSLVSISDSAPDSATKFNQQTVKELSELVPPIAVIEDEALHFEIDESPDSFVRKIGDSARKIGKEKDLYASVMIAQAILESANGQSKLAQVPNYNLFGIKGTHNGKSISMVTQEDLGNGTLYTTKAGFRVYENYEDCFTDYATLLKEGISGNIDFYAGVWRANAKTYQEATKFLTGRYTMDTEYNKKLNGLIATYDLTQYDKETQVASVSAKD